MIDISIRNQPDDSTCGPTSLHAVYQYYKDDIRLSQVIAEVERVTNGGTLAPLLGIHALQRGYQCVIHPYNIYIFDPSWFFGEKLKSRQLIEKLEMQHELLESERYRECSQAYISFLKHGGKIDMVDMNTRLLNNYFSKKIPVLTGVSATYLYRCKREYEDANGRLVYDDIKGLPSGHFVVLCGHEEESRSVVIADPLKSNPAYEDNYYRVPMSHLISAMMLGVLTNDANILVIKPKG